MKPGWWSLRRLRDPFGQWEFVQNQPALRLGYLFGLEQLGEPGQADGELHTRAEFAEFPESLEAIRGAVLLGE